EHDPHGAGEPHGDGRGRPRRGCGAVPARRSSDRLAVDARLAAHQVHAVVGFEQRAERNLHAHRDRDRYGGQHHHVRGHRGDDQQLTAPRLCAPGRAGPGRATYHSPQLPHRSAVMNLWTILAWVGRIGFAAFFVKAGVGHLTNAKAFIGYAQSKGVPAAALGVPLSGAMLIAGGLLILFSWHAIVGAALLVLFLVPTAFLIHNYWTESDPMM